MYKKLVYVLFYDILYFLGRPTFFIIGWIFSIIIFEGLPILITKLGFSNIRCSLFNCLVCLFFKFNGYARAQYVRTLTINGDAFRDKLNLKNKKTRQLKREQRILENPDLVIKIGRPKKIIIENIQPIIKNVGRPRKYNI